MLYTHSRSFTCVKLILHTNSHHQHECVEVMYTNPAIYQSLSAGPPPNKRLALTANDFWVPYKSIYLEVLMLPEAGEIEMYNPNPSTFLHRCPCT